MQSCFSPHQSVFMQTTHPSKSACAPTVPLHSELTLLLQRLFPATVNVLFSILPTCLSRLHRVAPEGSGGGTRPRQVGARGRSGVMASAQMVFESQSFTEQSLSLSSAFYANIFITLHREWNVPVPSILTPAEKSP